MNGRRHLAHHESRLCIGVSVKTATELWDSHVGFSPATTIAASATSSKRHYWGVKLTLIANREDTSEEYARVGSGSSWDNLD
jgi:hypothetical protein